MKRKLIYDVLTVVIALILVVTLFKIFTRGPSDPPIQRPPRHPGFAGDDEGRAWDRASIERFLTAQIPNDATNFRFEGEKGAPYFLPHLTFSFHTSPASAEKFVHHFCNGVLHPGYNPLEAQHSSIPGPDRVLIRGFGAIHYSYSPGVSTTIMGNRCARLDERLKTRRGRPNYRRWIEEIALDTTNPNDYIVNYRLPLRANEAPVDYFGFYPIGLAHMEAPLARAFRLHVTGLKNVGPPPKAARYPENPFFIVMYHTVCIETDWVKYDYFALSANWELMRPYTNSDIAIYVDDLSQRPAHMVGDSLAPRLKPDGNLNNEPDLWEYCLDSSTWEPGPHTMRLVVTPPESEPETFEFDFYVKAQVSG